MQRLLIGCAVGLALLFGGVAPTPASAYYYRHHFYPYRYHGNYYNYRYHGNYYNYRYHSGYYRYRYHGDYYNHRVYRRHHYRYW